MGLASSSPAAAGAASRSSASIEVRMIVPPIEVYRCTEGAVSNPQEDEQRIANFGGDGPTLGNIFLWPALDADFLAQARHDRAGHRRFVHPARQGLGGVGLAVDDEGVLQRPGVGPD